MTVVLDAGVALACYDLADPGHSVAGAWLARLDDELVTTPLVLSELDRLVTARGGDRGRDRLWLDLEAGAYTVRWWADALRESLLIARRHPSLTLADASLVALTTLTRTNRIATFDHHFRSVTTPDGEGLVLLPDDA